MGVRGLTTFLRDNRSALSKQEIFKNTPGASKRPLVIDGWSLIYALYYDSGLPWVYGGEYENFAILVKNLVNAWIAVGFEPFFVFDGPVPLLKTSTTLKQYAQSIKNADIFFRTSASTRSSPNFLASKRILPPLLFEVCLSILKEFGSSSRVGDDSLSPPKAHILMADDEADPYCVALAGKLRNGLVLGLDSDFSVLDVEGYGGYVPLDEISWSSLLDNTSSAPQGRGDRLTSARTKQHSKHKMSGLIPPDSAGELSLKVTIYHPHNLASYLGLPPPLLPLFGALVGNDFSSPYNAKQFFEPQTSSAERIWKVARAVSVAVKELSDRGEVGAQGDGLRLLDVTQTSVLQLLVRPDTLTGGAMKRIVDQTVAATLECTLTLTSPSPSSSCAIHAEDECPLSSLSPEFLNAYREGKIHPRLANAATTGIVFPKLFLEDPGHEPCGNACKTVWDWVWAVFTAGGHIPFVAPEESESTRAGAEPGADAHSQVINAVGEFAATNSSISSKSADLALELKDKFTGLSLEEYSPVAVLERKSPVQYARRGSKLVPELIQLPISFELPSLGGAHNWTRKDRISVFLEGTRSHTVNILEAFEMGDVQVEKLLWICTLRSVVQSSPSLGESAAAPSVVGKWRKTEARGFISSLSCLAKPNPPLPPLNTRTIQRTAQLLYAFDAVARLAEVLYLFHEEVGRAVRMFSGRAVHLQLQGEVDETAWGLICDAIGEGVWAYEPGKPKAWTKKQNTGAATNTSDSRRSMGFNAFSSKWA
ncbi:XPG domain protein [Rhizoctonia solani 123E]|uniref:XPG domain protein n=1 Tax=Rhizoctonia solani 123E TaxID=1423351 RepID=A0A074RMP0_9AGAM|nr:XPG domain protein [Rhizoctonia solani 123E]